MTDKYMNLVLNYLCEQYEKASKWACFSENNHFLVKKINKLLLYNFSSLLKIPN